MCGMVLWKACPAKYEPLIWEEQHHGEAHKRLRDVKRSVSLVLEAFVSGWSCFCCFLVLFECLKLSRTFA